MPPPAIASRASSIPVVFTLTLSAACAVQAGAPFAEPGVVVIHELQGEGPAWGFGSAVAQMRDITGDGIQELIVNEPANSAVFPNNGRAYVFSGATGQLVPGMTFTGAGANVFLGSSIADAGDVNGDAVTDIIIGSPGAFFGASTVPGRVDVFSGADGSFLIGREGDASGDKFGYAVAGAGDVNRDGFADVLVGAAFADTTAGLNAGRAFVLSGKDALILRSWEGEQAQDRFGGGIAECGDLDQDGFVDHIIGAFRAGPTATGRAYVYSGATGLPLWPRTPHLQPSGTAGTFAQFFVATAGDVNADGTLDVYVGDYAVSRAHVYSGVDGSELLSIAEGAPGGLGCGRGAGDVNGDGHADLVLGAFTSDAGALNAGRTYIYSGSDGSLLRTITATTPNHGFGWDAVGVGDVNGDGAPDYLIGAAGGNGDRAYVIAGQPLPRPCPADFNRSGAVDGIDLAVGLAAWGRCPLCIDSPCLCPPDLDGSGQVNGVDLAMLLAAWGPCP